MSSASQRTLDWEARRRAIECLDVPLVVEAGAGTGKTTLLVTRIVHALERGAIAMPQLVAITFTEKAAAEMRLRLRQALEGRLAETEVPESRQRLARAQRDLHRATVSTIHAFAAGLLRERPLSARLDPQFRTLDELESRQMLRQYWIEWTAQRLERDTGGLRRALEAGLRLEPDLFDLARETYDQRDVADLVERPRMPPALLAEMQSLRAGIEACVQHAAVHCRDAQDPGGIALRRLGQHLAMLDDLEAASWPGFFLQRLALPLQPGRKDAWDDGALAESRGLRGELRTRLDRLRLAIADAILHDIVPWLAAFRSDYQEEKRRRSVLDFQDLLLMARDLVRDDLAVRRELGDRIGMLCVDEFQDTDPLQAELVLFLSETGPAAVRWQDVRASSKLFLVGDPKQSIYRFRRADLDMYWRCVDIVLGSGGERLSIVENFRSRPGILRWVNGVFAAAFAPRDGSPQPDFEPLRTQAADGARDPVWVLRPPASAALLGAEANRRAEAAAIVRWIERALDEEWPVRDAGGERPLRAGDIAVLFGRTSGIEIFEAALRGAGLPFQQEGGKLFFQRQEVRDLLQGLAAIDDPNDEMSIVSVLRSAMFGATDAELWEHRAACGSFDYVGGACECALAGRLRILADLHAERHAKGVAATLRDFLARTQAQPRLVLSAAGGAALNNVEMLVRHARQFEAGRPAGLREFVRSMRDLDADVPRIAEWAPEEGAEERIRLLTVHVAKGLEFPCVVLANLNARGSSRQPGVLVDRAGGRSEIRLRGLELDAALETPGYAPLAQQERQREAAEERRLLYVAATRARDHLVVADFHGGKREGYARILGEVGDVLVDGAVQWAAEGTTGGAAGTGPSRRRSVAAGVDLAALRSHRHACAQEQARRVRSAAWDAGRPPAEPPLGAAEGNAGRLRPALLRLLERAVARGAAAGLEDLTGEVVALQGCEDLEPLLLRTAERSLRSDAARAWFQARRIEWRTPLCVAWGSEWYEGEVDLHFEAEASSWVAVRFDLGGASTNPSAARIAAEAELLRQCHALRRSGRHVTGAGVFCPEAGRFWPVDALEDKLAVVAKSASQRP